MVTLSSDTHLVHLVLVGLAALLHATLQLGLGCAILLYHGSVGRRHVSQKTNTLVSSFIAGIGLAVLVLLAAICYFIVNLGQLNQWGLLALVGVLVLLALVTVGFYYRRSGATELWVPRPVARFLDQRAHQTQNNTEAYLLGTMSSFGELPFALPLLVLAANSVLMLPTAWQLLAVALYVVLVTLPLVIFRVLIRSGRDLAGVQAWRRRSKNFFRASATCGYLILAGLVFVFLVLEGLL